ncbi:MAG: GntR family transcriptional regulator [Streptococcaceae bacterium]|jgi:GntR family transcriptional regulator|nr:GntR family transcriptional regulator [Streptococcaceae bacterium]
MITIDKTSVQPFYEQIILSIKRNILLGIYETDEKLPSVRELASNLMMNPNTIAKAYKSLEQEGVIVTKKGLGTFVGALSHEKPLSTQIDGWKNKLAPIITEAKFYGITLEEIMKWMKEAYEGESK